jgi:diguanylate cyclase (GGDEF)-like protein
VLLPAVSRPTANSLATHARSARQSLLGGLAALSLLFVGAHCAIAGEQATGELLKHADAVKTADPADFTATLARVDAQSGTLSTTDRNYLRYLRGWRSAYDGQYDAAIPQLKSLIADSSDPTLQFRARATIVNVLVLATQYEEAFLQLGGMLTLLPQVTDHDAREQGLGIAAFLYNQVGEYDIGLNYAEKLIEENWAGRGACNGGQLKIEALYKTSRLKVTDTELQASLDACAKLGETIYSSAIRTYIARLDIDQGRYDEAIKLLSEHHEEVRAAHYPRMIAEYDALLAQAYRQTGNVPMVRKFALSAIESGVKNQYTEPLSTAYRLLYLLAKEQGETAAALTYYEQYSAADKGYLDDVSARQLAYERVKHEALASELQIETLNKQNQLLQLQRENNRLYIALLIMVLGFIVLWAYKTKRSQLHFMKLSRQDGLTGISNRPHFIELAEAALDSGRRTQQEVCVILCDLDHFKLINDRHGHATGDFVLKQTVAACQAHLRAGDIFGRFGGEEFGFVLPGCNLLAARQRAEQMRLAIASISTPREGAGDAVPGASASFGIATSSASGYELRQLLAQADAALYQAKHAGRNRVILAEVAVVSAIAVLR